MRKHYFIFAAVISLASSAATASPFASRVVESVGYPTTPGLYTNPDSILGKPAVQFYDAFEDQTFRTSVVSAPYGTAADQSTPVITTIAASQSITVEFDHNVEDDPQNPFGVDLIVFGNSFFTASSPVTPTTNMGSVNIASGVNSEPVTVEVAQSLSGPWYSFAPRTADGLFPTQGYLWNEATSSWGAESDFTKPVDPSLTEASFAGLTAAEAIALYDGSGGGTGFDLAASGFEWIRYVRLTGDGGEIDALADVTPIPEPGSALASAASAGLLLRRSRKSRRRSRA